MSDLCEPTVRSLRRVLMEQQVEHRVPGIVGGVVRDGELVWADGVGSGDLAKPGVAPNRDSQFQIASITKTFTAVLVMSLRDEGRLSLDDSIERHIPESTHPGVTIRQMLSHATGMQREAVGDVWDTLTFPSRKELVSGWNKAERVMRPHHRWHYSNLAYSMLGEVVARLDGCEWAESLHRRILDPLEMKDTSVGLVDMRVKGYYLPPFHDVPVAEPVLDFLALAPAGSIASTASDLARWAAFLADPVHEVLSPDTVEEMCQPQIMADLDRWQLAWGLGLELARSGERVFVGHEGGNPGSVTGLFVNRASKTGGIVLMNATTSPDPAALAIKLAEQVLEHEPADPDPWVPGHEVPPEFEGILGRWFSEGSPFTLTVEKGRLKARGEGAPLHRAPSVFTKVADDVYRTESGRETGELLRVTRDDQGTVTHMHWATYLMTRDARGFSK